MNGTRMGVMCCVLLFLFAGMTFSPQQAAACSCAAPPPVADDMERKTAVFAGKVMDIAEPRSGVVQSSADLRTVLFEVTRAWKGVETTQVVVHTARSEESCGYEGFAVGQEYVVFAYGNEDSLKTGLCERTKPVAAAAEELEQLGSAYVPSQRVDLASAPPFQDNSTMRIGLWAGAIAVLLLAIVLWVRKRLARK